MRAANIFLRHAHSLRANAIPFLGLAILTLAYLSFCLSADMFDASGDASGYLLAAQYFSPFQPASSMLQAYSHEIIYPPLFPLMIAALGGTTLSGSLIVIAAVIGSTATLYLWLRSEGLGNYIAAATSLLFALMPVTYLTALNLWTENPYLFFSIAAVYCVSRAEHEQHSGKDSIAFWLAASLAVACATLCRVAALPLLIAFCLYVSLRRPTGFFSIVGIAALPFCIWIVWARLSQLGVGGYTSQWQSLYRSDAWTVLFRTAGAWVQALADSWTDGFVGDVAGTPFQSIAAIVGLLGIAGWLVRLWNRKFDALYVACYMAMLLAWPHPEESSRYGYVIVPFALTYAVLFLHDTRDRFGGRIVKKYLLTVVLAVCVGVVLPGLVVNYLRYVQPVPAEMTNVKHMDGWYSNDGLRSIYLTPLNLKIIQHLKSIHAQIPEGECVFSVKPTIVSVHSRHASFPVPLDNLADDDFEEKLARCRFVHVVALSYANRPSFYPLGRVKGRARAISSVTMGEGERMQIVSAVVEILPK